MKTILKAGLHTRLILTIFSIGISFPFHSNAQATHDTKKSETIRLTFESAQINSKTIDIVTDERLTKGKGTSLKNGIKPALENQRTEADLIFNIKTSSPGRFIMRTSARTNEEGVKILKGAKTKFESLFIKIQFDENRPTKRVVYVPWDVALQTSGKFDLTGKPQTLKIWLPKGVNFDYVEFSNYTPPAVPEKAETYAPAIVPPSGRPRVWVNQESLPNIKAGILADENAPAWAQVKQTALTPFVFKFDPKVETQYNEPLEIAAERKAFYYLITGDEKIGREAVNLIDEYLSNVEFGNLLDITRELGRAIYTSSEVYDWCYKLMTPDQKNRIYHSLIRLADDMEIGWPPFLESVVYGHGNEAQVNRDLLTMSIAIYDEDPKPYKYTSYAILEQLVPMRKFQYESGRHNQGVNYGAYRLGWDLHAATLFSKMTGKEVFDSNIKNLDNQWMYMRLPNGQMLRDGDGFNIPKKGQPLYWGPPLPLLLFYSYSKNPYLKYDFQHVDGTSVNPVLYLLLNDPNLKALADRSNLPLTKDFGPVLSSMVARTGWNFGENSNDVVAEIKGGGYQFANHQHSDAGAIQLYYRGFQFGDIGLYKFYGTPYDLNFNKSSLAHSMMLTVDPNEKFSSTTTNSGGSRSVRVNPESEEQVLKDPLFYYGKVVSSDHGPSKLKPFYSYFSVDLKGAYSEKLENYNRRFCFVNMGRTDIPAVIVLSDDITSADPTFKKYWQINTLSKPENYQNQIVLNAKDGDKVGKTYVNMLYPNVSERNIETLTGEDALSAFGEKFKTPDETLPESHASRIMISPIKANKTDRFLTVFQVADGETKPLPVKHTSTEINDIVIFADRVVSMPKGTALLNEAFEINVPAGEKQYQIILNGIKEGDWNVKSTTKQNFNIKVLNSKNTIFFLAKPGIYKISPGNNNKYQFLKIDENLMPK